MSWACTFEFASTTCRIVSYCPIT